MIALAITLWFLYYLLNYAEITHAPAGRLKRALGPRWGYPLSCPICLSWWLTFFAYLVTADWLLATCFIVPVLTLFIDLAYQRLSGNCPPCVEGKP